MAELHGDKSSRFDVLNEVHQRLHDMKNLQRASAWPHVEGVARAEKMVLDMIAACQPKDSEPFTRSHALSNGWKLVPPELTEPMRIAGFLYKDKIGARVLYRALLDAAPQASAILSEDRREGGPDTGVTREDAKPGHAGACGAAPSSAPSTTPRIECPECQNKIGGITDHESWCTAGKPNQSGVIDGVQFDKRDPATRLFIAANYWREKHDLLKASAASAMGEKPLPMVLHCPACGLQHVDAKETHGLDDGEQEPEEPAWNNPPHRSHLCHGCGCIWRPADVPTNGVKAITTRGKADTWPNNSPDGGKAQS